MQAHLEKNIDFLASDLAKNYTFVSNGDIGTPTVKEIRAGLEDYLGNTTFSRYEYTREPIIGFSRDGSVAWSIVQLDLEGVRKLPDGSQAKLGSTWAWITLFERRNDRWLRITEVSNRKPLDTPREAPASIGTV